MNHEATIATLNMQLDNCAQDLYEKDKRIAELENAIHGALKSGRGTSGRIILELSDEQDLREVLAAIPSAPSVEPKGD